jgi:2-polyprenyl-3-methyl-5-hydroxy-6-metoxy-1,4-benzoquinol methylase
MKAFSSTSYYDAHAQDFFDTTVKYNLSEIYIPFLVHLSKGAKILDAGCGSGRDSKYFASQGYAVEAFDGSLELVKLARELTGLPIYHKRFEDVAEKEIYDGIWAAASLLHVPKDELPSILEKLKTALKPKGVWYMSFRYGEGEHDEGDRYFYDHTEESLTKILTNLGSLSILHMTVPESLKSRRGFKFLCCVVRKNY